MNDFSQSLLDIFEARVMKRMSINHCVEVDADNYQKETRKYEPEFNSTGYEKRRLEKNDKVTDKIVYIPYRFLIC